MFRLPWMHPDAGVFVEGWVVAVLVMVCLGSGGFWRHGIAVRWPEVAPPAPIMGVPVVTLRLRLVSRAVYPPDISTWWAEQGDRKWAWHCVVPLRGLLVDLRPHQA